jgi:hypothetical protein
MKSKAMFDTDMLVNELAAISDLRMRSARLIERIAMLKDPESAYALDRIIDGNIHGKPKFKQVYLALIKVRDLFKALGPDKGKGIYEEAKDKGYKLLVEMFLGPELKKAREKERESSALATKLIHMTLGEKKAFARRKDFKHLEFLMHDSNPSVIFNLLQNPRITEREVIKMASSKAAAAGVLEEIFNNNKWISRYRVKKALVFNELTPLDISLSLASFLLRQDLELIVRDGKLDPSLVSKARSILDGK